ncbi:zinc finger protein 236 [Drosophila busckii]|uniref:zinc finger protein 236 n=1 Tax=Drosophila busckii TaxID=30019 RepID=UPI00083EBDA7|nr:zinc finger protein 236 [Drosophila busckii]
MATYNMLTDEQAKLNSRLEAHIVYICPECGKAFRTQVEWRQHLNMKHDYLSKTFVDFKFTQVDEHFHECQVCFKYVENAHKTIALLQYHYFLHLEHRETYRCVHCRCAYTRRRALNEHLMNTHLKEIEKYEAKLKQAKRSTGDISSKIAISKQQAENRKDLLQKALLDIDLQTELPENTVATKLKAKPNASEQALDRCLDAYEDIIRKETENEENPEELNELCEEFFEEQPSESTNAQQPKELVIIEIDALGKEEVASLKKKMSSQSIRKAERESSPPKKRRRLPTQEEDENPEMSSNELAKLISYLCPTCGKEIDAMDDWRKHVFKMHDFENFIGNSFKIKDTQSTCLQCHDVLHTTSRSDLQKHCFKHLPYRSYLKCTLCDRTKTSMSKMFNHIRYNHQDELQNKNKTQIIVKSEPRSTQTQRITKQHENHDSHGLDDKEDNDDDDNLTCQYCNKIFKTKWRFDRHILLCKASGAPKHSYVTTADDLLKHLQEGRQRIHAIWSKMQTTTI